MPHAFGKQQSSESRLNGTKLLLDMQKCLFFAQVYLNFTKIMKWLIYHVNLMNIFPLTSFPYLSL